MIDFLYNILIFPLVQIVEISFVIVYRIFNNRALAILGVSATVTALTSPLYFIAEKWQKTERELRARLEPKIKKIKSVFKGDEQYMVLSAYYRQNHYHPIYSLRSSLGLFIQVPFFLATYSYLSNLEFIKGVPFVFIQDLGTPDRLLHVGGLYINLLPVLMTVINCFSGLVYTKGFVIREKVQVYGMAFIFLVLLYNSPSGLVLYWTMNNIFSLIKNILSNTKHSLKIVYGFLCLCVIFIYIRFIPLGFSPKRLFVAALCSLIFSLPLFIRLFKFCIKKFSTVIQPEYSSLSSKKTFILSACILFVLSGLVIPASLIASSVQEFSFLDSYTTPLPFIYIIFVQAMGVFLLWPLIVYFLFSKNVKTWLNLIISLLSVTALINTFIFPGDSGFLTTSFRFSNPDTFESKYKIIILSGLATIGILCVFIYLLLTRRKFIFYSFQLIILTALILFGSYIVFKINNDFMNYAKQRQQSDISAADFGQLEPVYNFSRNGQNVIVIMLDAAISGYIPYIFNEKPELFNNFSGFTYYPNCVSFGSHTRIGAPVLFGGYEYEPRLIQKDRSYAKEKHNEALLMMPRIFLNAGYRVTVTEPAFANYSWKPDLSIFAPYPEIKAQNIRGNYTGMWLRSYPEMKIVSVPDLLRELLIRFSFLRISSPALRIFIYDRGDWLKEKNASEQFSPDTLDCYTTLYYLPLITDVLDSTENTYTAMVNDLTHDTAIFQYPDYIPKMVVTNQGDGPFAEKESYHAMMAAFLLLGKWFVFLQEQGVYDNARILIVSDHGKSEDSKYSGNIILPNNDWLSGYHALLLVKDFMSTGELFTDTTFMTQGDVPFIAMNELIDYPKNPFSNNPVVSVSARKNEAVITTASVLQYKIADDQWLHVHENIFEPNNWERVKN
jgi:YidC/Oxa1 family membrane protein insertase